jgi:hypothetical protein
MPDIHAERHIRTVSLEHVEASAVVTADTLEQTTAQLLYRLVGSLNERFLHPQMCGLRLQEPNRRGALRLTLQYVDEGASDAEIRQLARIELAAFDSFIERERPKMLTSTPGLRN